jgi:hypothetical protein
VSSATRVVALPPGAVSMTGGPPALSVMPAMV